MVVKSLCSQGGYLRTPRQASNGGTWGRFQLSQLSHRPQLIDLRVSQSDDLQRPASSPPTSLLLRMDNIHAPTVASGPSSRPLANGNAAHLSFAELQKKKEDVEAELKALSGILDSVCCFSRNCPGRSR